MLNKVLIDFNNLDIGNYQFWQWAYLGYEELYRWASIISTPLTLWLIAKKVTLESAKRQDKISDEQNKQKALNGYFERMTKLLVEKHLSLKPFGSPEVKAARALTLSVLRELDPERNKQVIQFLSDASLIQNKLSGSTPTLLREVSLSGVNLRKAILSHADLSGSEISSANLSCTFIENTNLSNAYLICTDLSGACLNNSNLKDACLIGAILNGTELKNADLENANLRNSYISHADLEGASLVCAKFGSTSLKKINLADSNLSGVNLRSFDLNNLYLKRAKYTKDHSKLPDTMFPENFNPKAAGMIKVENE
ncbi:pentapeptide repeat-containing protein [Myxosarcina sp. GI1]|uniref:pentapeptide repeat-containing protein n=1 Tax=Myxosarcina sp. GI1 TaxID=1541065 RepID=UPI00068BFAD2|nr:pentapeptide repeat-containing protein [Myxosarcina sp. GI1]